MKLVLCFALLAVALCDSWAVLVAGSNTYSNYRHQADICHSYQILKDGGIPESNIITFMYDDIANNPRNPYKGQIFNNPNHVNVYNGVTIDYSGADVTPANFLRVLRGQSLSVGSGKTLGSTADDKVFINFSDHGGSGLIAFPSQYLYANDLISALEDMHSANMYDELVFYLEACESGSMFDGLLSDDLKIYATTAANPYQSSYAYYYDSALGTYLGDEYSISWTEDIDNHANQGSLNGYSLQDQFTYLKQKVAGSEVCQYGDVSFKNEDVSDFVKPNNAVSHTALNSNGVAETADSRDVPFLTAWNQLRTATPAQRPAALSELKAEARTRAKWAKIFDQFVAEFQLSVEGGEPVKAEYFDMYREIIGTTEYMCGRFDDYALSKTNLLIKAIASGVSIEEIQVFMANLCMA
eukprot:gnl/Dysnectes_brevis/783_a863_5687.p1 GENE.gnl/Dysnectes_brevis/783_a863_5687~~gnl/Dysnectes_brevis/783_a863_5687.p1  ORF type:complete len:411 (-),score=197.79 gnl/Dysnectes_brevis/783_a863_5687:53-1285(-)